MKESVGYNLKFKPKDVCSDVHCPYHGEISVRGKIFSGLVVSDSMDKTVRVEWDNILKDTKFSRYFKTRSRILAHNPGCIGAKKGDRVKVAETRPISKTKSFVVLEVLENAGSKEE